MRVTAIDRYEIDPGTVTEWTLAAPERLRRSSVPPSYNQRFHLDTARTQGVGRSVWMAGSFDVPGQPDPDTLRRTFDTFIRRHDALWTGFDVHPDRIERHIVSPDALGLERSAPREFTDTTALRNHLRDRFTRVCDPLTFPAFLFATVERDTRTTIIAAFDHTIVDGYSLAIAVRELSTIHEILAFDPEATAAEVDALLGPAGSFMAFCETEHQAGREATVTTGDPRVRAWAKFYDDCGGTAPSFPLDLGVEAGRPVAQASDVQTVLGGAESDRFEEHCLRAGGTMFTGILAALAMALRLEGGPDRLPLQFPLHTRRDPRWENAVGWLTTSAPLTVPITEGDFATTLVDTHAAFRSALTLGGLSMGQIHAGVGERYRRTRTDLFMASYIDYRRLAGSERHGELNAHHISNVTVCDDAQFWVSRTGGGLSLRSRFPNTATGHTTIGRFVARLSAVLGAVAQQGIAAPARPSVAVRVREA
ncbi:condensation protein [Rhodococcus triatomae]|uniref:Condensation domain-containing protein n=1 Tax=Rhodococcus triatomae TaxID=300028 RepID=A0A1G8K334_9NOCA|nr:condensation domain-containing protein [Rhodococcus triatomae]QNG18810.1 condensation protein [Rhodococcus triatomae]QNG25279.1 condensation protein [Rhodococcus triatomae]SDI37855.1 Condensation domain-containing protein [Rhodococcus triatomae]